MPMLVSRNRPETADNTAQVFPIVWSVLWNIYALLWFQFRFRLWKSFGSGSGSGYHSSPKTKQLHKIFPFQCQKQLISQKVGHSFLIFWLFYYILCWIQIQIRFWNRTRNKIQNLNRNGFRFRYGKMLRFLRFRIRLHNNARNSFIFWLPSQHYLFGRGWQNCVFKFRLVHYLRTFRTTNLFF